MPFISNRIVTIHYHAEGNGHPLVLIYQVSDSINYGYHLTALRS